MVDVDRIRLHQQTLDLALASRRTVLRMAALAIAGAVKLVAMLAMPGGVVGVVPAVLRFIEQLRVEFENGEWSGATHFDRRVRP